MIQKIKITFLLLNKASKYGNQTAGLELNYSFYLRWLLPHLRKRAPPVASSPIRTKPSLPPRRCWAHHPPLPLPPPPAPWYAGHNLGGAVLGECGVIRLLHLPKTRSGSTGRERSGLGVHSSPFPLTLRTAPVKPLNRASRLGLLPPRSPGPETPSPAHPAGHPRTRRRGPFQGQG